MLTCGAHQRVGIACREPGDVGMGQGSDLRAAHGRKRRQPMLPAFSSPNGWSSSSLASLPATPRGVSLTRRSLRLAP
jgi:hypothetical protein